MADQKQQHLYKAPTPLPAADSVVVHGPLPPAAAGWAQRGEGWKKYTQPELSKTAFSLI